MFSTLKTYALAIASAVGAILFFWIKILRADNKALEQENVLHEEKEEIRDELDAGKKSAEEKEREILNKENPDIDSMRDDI